MVNADALQIIVFSVNRCAYVRMNIVKHKITESRKFIVDL